jgi:hypothetical protein
MNLANNYTDKKIVWNLSFMLMDMAMSRISED